MVTDFQAVLGYQLRPDERSGAELAEGRLLVGCYREGERRQPVLVRPYRDDEHSLRGLLINAPDELDGDDHLDPWHRLDLLDHAQRERGGKKTHPAMHDQQIGARFGNQVLDAALQALQHAEQREGNADLEENEDSPPGLAPDTGPDERQKSHAAVPAGSSLNCLFRGAGATMPVIPQLDPRCLRSSGRGRPASHVSAGAATPAGKNTHRDAYYDRMRRNSCPAAPAIGLPCAHRRPRCSRPRTLRRRRSAESY